MSVAAGKARRGRPGAVRRTGLPASLTPALTERLTRRVTAGPDAERRSTYAPFNGELIAELPQSTEQDVITAYTVARQAQSQWARTPVKARAQIFLRYHDLVLDRQNEVLDLIQVENGKARQDAFLEAAENGMVSRYYARCAPALLRPRRRRGMIPGLTSTIEMHHPKGVVAVISPWNYPLTLAAGDAIPALLAGNAVVHKPDIQTALTALWAADLLHEAGLPEGLWQIVLSSGRTLGTPLVDNADYLMFTGSTNTGRQLAKDAGGRLIGSSLELGGKNPMIVLDDANLNRAVEGAVRACFSSTGQLCISMERLYVHAAIYDEFKKRFVERVKRMRLGAAYDYSCDMGSLTTQRQLDTVSAHVEDAKAKGATLLAGGRARPDLGPLFYEPTVLTNVSPDMICYGQETFGPLVSVYRFSDVEQAIARANDSPYGLNASLWTRDAERGQSVAARLHTGTVNINEAYVPGWGSMDAPMGGMGDSGLGRRHGAEGLLKYTEAQTVVRQRLMNLAPPKGVSQKAFAKVMTTSLKTIKRARLK